MERVEAGMDWMGKVLKLMFDAAANPRYDVLSGARIRFKCQALEYLWRTPEGEQARAD